jgi:hypothetical protein
MSICLSLVGVGVEVLDTPPDFAIIQPVAGEYLSHGLAPVV